MFTRINRNSLAVLGRARRTLLQLPGEEEELYRPVNKAVTLVGEVESTTVTAFNILSSHFSRSWGFMWSLQENGLSRTLAGFPECDRARAYEQLASRNCDWLRERLPGEEHCHVYDGMLTVGGEVGKRIISEAYQHIGLPPLVSFKCDLAFLDLKNKVPLGWIVRKAPVAINIHPAPPEKPGAGVYVPSLLAREKQYGITVHYTTERVDAGPIIAVRRFSIPKGATFTSLRYLTTQHCLEMLEELLLHMKFTEPLTDMKTTCHYSWGGSQLTRRMVRQMLKKTERDYGQNGHPALL